MSGPPGVGWGLCLYPDAMEAGGRFYGAGEPWTDREPGDGVAAAAESGRAEIEAARRARGKVRRYCASNRLNRLGTLTYAGEGCHDQVVLRGHVGEFFRSMRSELDSKAFPYLWVPELHPGGHGWHVHFVVGRYIERSAIVRAWPYGFVHIKLIGSVPAGSGTLGEARRAARYLGKYVGKGFVDGRMKGRHRYEIAQHFQPRCERVFGSTLEIALGRASRILGSEPTYSWQSVKVTGSTAPPMAWFSWDG